VDNVYQPCASAHARLAQRQQEAASASASAPGSDQHGPGDGSGNLYSDTHREEGYSYEYDYDYDYDEAERGGEDTLAWFGQGGRAVQQRQHLQLQRQYQQQEQQQYLPSVGDVLGFSSMSSWGTHSPAPTTTAVPAAPSGAGVGGEERGWEREEGEARERAVRHSPHWKAQYSAAKAKAKAAVETGALAPPPPAAAAGGENKGNRKGNGKGKESSPSPPPPPPRTPLQQQQLRQVELRPLLSSSLPVNIDVSLGLGDMGGGGWDEAGLSTPLARPHAPAPTSLPHRPLL
jgi:hypothetical protein